jgi:vitamin B12 transporter
MLTRLTPVFAGILLAPSLIWAQTAAPPQIGPPADLDSDTIALAEIVVTASSLPTPRARLPQSVTVLRGDDLRTRGVILLQDALREVPGLHVVRTGSVGGTTSVFLRGGNSNFVKVLLDGIPLNEPGGRFDFGSFSLENVDRIEVVRGPSSVLHGSDAMAGVIQIFTRPAEGLPVLSGSVRAGSMASLHAEGAARGAGDRMNYSLALGRSETAGRYEFNNRFATWTGSGRVAVTPDAHSQVALSLRVQESRYGFPTSSTGDVVDLNQYTFDEGVHVALEGARTLKPALEGRILLRASRAERGLDNQPDSPADTLGFAFRDERLGTTLRRGVDARLVGARGGVTWVAGVDWELERERLLQRTTSNFGAGPSLSATAFDGDRWTLAGYLETTLAGPLGSRVNLGARADQNEVFGAFQTGQAGVVLPVGALGRIRGALGSAYKAPTFAQQFVVSPFEVGDPDLTPETSRSWEVGWDATLAPARLTVGASYFDQRYRDLIQYGFRGPDLPTYANEARARARGAEVALDWRPLAALRAGLEYTWTDAALLDANGEVVGEGIDARLLRRPEHQWSGHLRARHGSGATAGVTVVRVGDRIDSDFRQWPAARVQLGAYSTVDVDAQIPLRFGARPAALTLRAENLLGAEYESIVGFSGMGRVLWLGLRWNP